MARHKAECIAVRKKCDKVPQAEHFEIYKNSALAKHLESIQYSDNGRRLRSHYINIGETVSLEYNTTGGLKLIIAVAECLNNLE